MKTQSICLALVVAILCPCASAQWKQTNGPRRGPASCFAVSGSDVYAGFPNGGLFRSTNNGISWSAASTGLTNTDVHALAVCSDGAGNKHLFAGTAGGLFLSTNNGSNWTQAATGFTGTTHEGGIYTVEYISALVVSSDGAGGTNLFAAAPGAGVYLSSDKGTSWVSARSGLTGHGAYVQALAVFPNDSGGTILFAGAQCGGVYRSTNNGTSWAAVNTGLTELDVRTLAVSSNGAGGTNLFAGTSSGDVFLSTDRGTSWTAVSAPDLHGHPVSALVISPAAGGTGDSDLYAATDGGVFLSTNNGTSWTNMSSNIAKILSSGSMSVSSLAFSGSKLFAGSNCGVFVTTNKGQSWTLSFCGGNPDVGIRSLAVRGTELFAGAAWGGREGGGCIFHSTDNGESWTPQMIGVAQAIVFQGHNVFAGTYEGGVLLSTNSGVSWKAVNAGLSDSNVYALTAVGTNLYAGTGSGVFLSTNNGTSWNSLLSGLTYRVCAFAVGSNGAGGTNLVVGTTGGGVFLSTNNGGTWTAVNSGLTDSVVNALAIIGTNLFAGTYHGAFLSTDNGTTWRWLNDSLWNANVSSFAVYSTNLIAGTDAGVLLWSERGKSWQSAHLGLYEQVTVLGLSDTYIFAGTVRKEMMWLGGTGVWKRPRTEVFTGVEMSPGHLPSAFKLAQNYPNPFNPSTTITYELPRTSHVSLSVYNMLGMEVATLVNAENPAGVHTAQFDAATLPSGVYFYRLQAGEFTQTKKLVLVK